MFPGHVISPLDDILWPVRYPYPTDFFSVHDLKSRLYATPSTACKNWKSTLCRDLQLMMLYYSEFCRTLDSNGCQLEQVILRK
jgi:hypothetical protein